MKLRYHRHESVVYATKSPHALSLYVVQHTMRSSVVAVGLWVVRRGRPVFVWNHWQLPKKLPAALKATALKYRTYTTLRAAKRGLQRAWEHA